MLAPNLCWHSLKYVYLNKMGAWLQKSMRILIKTIYKAEFVNDKFIDIEKSIDDYRW